MRAAGLIALLWTTAVAGMSAEPLKVVLSMERTRYALSDRLTVQVALVNVSDEPISVYRILKWGYAVGFVLHVFDERRHEVNLPMNDDDMAIPSTLSRADSYVILEPGHLLGTLRTDKLADWALKQGSYTIEVEYRSPVPHKYRNDARFWSREREVRRSNSITFQIAP
jgi:hypothetical protein